MRGPPEPEGHAAGLEALLRHGALGLTVVEASRGDWAQTEQTPGRILVGLHRDGAAPRVGLDRFDVLLSADPAAPRPWVDLTPETLEPALSSLSHAVQRSPVAAGVAAQILRMTLTLPFDQALALESMGYSLLLASGEFKRWRRDNPPVSRPEGSGLRVAMERSSEGLCIRLSRPLVRNAFDALMRDHLIEALEFAQVDPEQSAVTLLADGPDFSAGGDLNEFGQATDPAVSHVIRVMQSPARLIRALGSRMTVCVHGRCVGAGIEAPAAAAKLIARPGASFRLPELAMGLIPGAGGTATLPRRIGRQRTLYMALSGLEVDLETALRWAMVDEVA